MYINYSKVYMINNKLLRLGKVTGNLLFAASEFGSITLDMLFEKNQMIGNSKLFRNSKRQYVNKKIEILHNKGYLERINTSDTYQLSEKGKIFLWKLKKYRYIQNKNWDGKWRVVCFDIFERHRTKRDQFRHELKEIGFIQLQQSVWVYPFACEDYIELLKTHYTFGKNVRYMIVDFINDDKNLKQFFKLK